MSIALGVFLASLVSAPPALSRHASELAFSDPGRPYAHLAVPSVDGCGYLVLRGERIEWRHARGLRSEGWTGLFVESASPRAGERVEVLHSGPGRVRVVQQPRAENGLETILVVPDPQVTWERSGDVWSMPHAAGETHAIDLRLVPAAAYDDARRVAGELESEQRHAQELARRESLYPALEAWKSIALRAHSPELLALAREEYADVHRNVSFAPTEADRAKVTALLKDGVRAFYGDEGVVLAGESVMLLWPRDFAEHPSVPGFLAQLDLAFAALTDLTGQDPDAFFGRRLCFFFMQSGAAWFDHHVGMGRDGFGVYPPFSAAYFHEMGHDFFKYPTDLIAPGSGWGEGIASFALLRALEVLGFDGLGLRRIYDEGQRQLDEHLARGRPRAETGAYFMGATTFASFGARLDVAPNGIEWDWGAYRELLGRFRAIQVAPFSPRDRYRHFAATIAATFGDRVYERFVRIGDPVARDDPPLVVREQREILPALAEARALADRGQVHKALREMETLARRKDHRLRGEVQRLVAELRARIGDVHGAVRAAEELGILREWWLHEPIRAPREGALAFAAPLEAELGVAPRDIEGGGRSVREWTRTLGAAPVGMCSLDRGGFRPHHVDAIDGSVDLDTLLGESGKDPAITYAATVLASAAARRVDLRLGQDDDSAVYLNGEEIERIPAWTAVNPDQFWVPLDLRAGDNLLVLKIVNRGGPWGFAARVTGPDGLGAEGVSSRAPRAPPQAAPVRWEALWAIGREDGRSDDLAPWRNGEDWSKLYPDGVVLNPSIGDAKRSFSRIHPGPNDAWAGSGAHVFALRFDSESAQAEHELVVATLGQNRWTPPRLRIAVNGAGTSFVLPGSPDEVLDDPARGTPCRIVLRLPPGALRRGANQIELSIPDGSWVLYDALELRRRAGSGR